MADLIDRQAAIDFIDAGRICNPNEPRWSDNEIVNFLKSRPSAQRTGRWIFETLDGTPGYRPTVMFCSKCGRVSIADYSYCPNCGARMEVQDERA